jgi:membrane protein implicated in regulation of membrane protease activity
VATPLLSGQVITIEVLLDNDASIVIVDSKLTIYLSVSTLAMLFALAIVIIAIFVLVVVLLCTRKRKAKESESANIELTGMREFTTEALKSKYASNSSIYTSPTHGLHSSEEKRDSM